MVEGIHPMKKTISVAVDVSYLFLKRGCYISVHTDGNGCVEIVRKQDGTLQVCVDDVTLEAGIHRFEDIYGPDPFKDGDDDLQS